VHGTSSLKGATLPPDDILRITLNNGDNSDEIVFAFRPEGVTDEMTKYDSEKRFGSAQNVPNIFALKGGKKIVIGTYPEIMKDDTIRLGYKFGQSKEITLKVTNLDEFKVFENIYLLDKKTGTEINLRNTPEYTFTSTAGEDAGRFVLYFSHVATGVNDLGDGGGMTDDVMIYGTGSKGIVMVSEELISRSAGKGVIRVYNTLGTLIEEMKLTDARTTVNLPDDHGIYIIEVRAGDKLKTGKVTRTKH